MRRGAVPGTGSYIPLIGVYINKTGHLKYEWNNIKIHKCWRSLTLVHTYTWPHSRSNDINRNLYLHKLHRWSSWWCQLDKLLCMILSVKDFGRCWYRLSKRSWISSSLQMWFKLMDSLNTRQILTQPTPQVAVCQNAEPDLWAWAKYLKETSHRNHNLRVPPGPFGQLTVVMWQMRLPADKWLGITLLVWLCQ